jgi:hypothetical protein
LAAKIQAKLDGVGYVFTGTPFAGVDLDNAFDDSGKLYPWAAEIVERFRGCAYIEISPSGTGLHIIGEGSLPADAWHKVRPVGKNDSGIIEVYDTGRYFTVTGQVFENCAEIGEGQDALDWLQTKYRRTKAESPPERERPSQSDQIIIERAKNAANGALFSALMAGDISQHGDDHSAADMALCSILAFWTRDPSQIEGIFRTSGLMRSKWDERHGRDTYGRITIQKALEIVSPSQSPKGETVRHPLKVLNFHDFLALELPERGNVLSPILPQQGLIMLYGPRGIAKTWVALSMAWAAASRGLCIGGWCAERPWRVIYIDGEMPARVLQERLALIMQGAGGDCSPDYFTILTPDIQGDEGMPNLSTPDGRAALEPYIADREVVFIDNLATLSRGGRENEAESWLPMQEWCLDMRRRGKSVVLVHHAGKSGQQRGTSAREDILDTVISLRKSKDYEPNQGAKFEVHLEKARGITGTEAEPFAAELIQAPHGGVTWGCVPVQDEREAKVKGMLAEGLSVPDIVDETGLSRATVYRIKKRLGAE